MIANRDARVLILGAGPTGLGAAYRLKELGHEDFHVYDQADRVGGLATSYTDPQGFTWDVGGHVLDSHYAYFDDLLDRALAGDAWTRFPRQTAIWIEGRWVPYPIQYHLGYLAPETTWRCLQGLLEVERRGGAPTAPANFKEWVEGTFGQGLAETFMHPYNWKVWAYPPEEMDCGWARDRVAPIRFEKVLRDLLQKVDDPSWGPSTIRFPSTGGTGAIWEGVADLIGRRHISLGKRVACIDLAAHTVHFEDGTRDRYTVLISSLPLDRLIGLAGLDDLEPLARAFRHSAAHIVGVGLRGEPPRDIQHSSWMYFPENDCPFNRVMLFSRYSANHVPDGGEHWSLMAEVSESEHRPFDESRIVDEVLRGMRNTGLLPAAAEVVSTWHKRLEYGYPTPFLGRDQVLNAVHPVLEQSGVYSRGRFGGWKFEVSDQDHSVMQGVELVNRLLLGIPEVTYWFPSTVNGYQYGKPGQRGKA